MRFYDLPTDVLKLIYEYDNTRKDDMKHVLQELKYSCNQVYDIYGRNITSDPHVSRSLLWYIKQENRAREYFDSKRDTDYTFH